MSRVSLGRSCPRSDRRPDIVGAMLAPEFQLVRSDGSAYDAAEYLARGIPGIDAGFEISDVVATGFGDHRVVRYVLDLHERVGNGRIVGLPVQACAHSTQLHGSNSFQSLNRCLKWARTEISSAGTHTPVIKI